MFTYDGVVIHHYVYMMKVIQEVKVICFQQIVWNPKWENAMDEKMVALDTNATWELVLTQGKIIIGCTESNIMWIDLQTNIK
jgi:hypothetical protein